MSAIMHVFFYVVPAVEDAFAGVRAALEGAGDGRHRCFDVRLESADYELVRIVEFSARRFARFRYYGSIFRELEKRLGAILAAAPRDAPVVLYLSDESVWAEQLKDVQGRLLRDRPSLLVSVQHGFFLLETPRTLAVRRLVNFVSRRTVGHPVLGYGFGGGASEVHLVYGDRETRFVRGRGVAHVYPCPRLIKYDLLQRYQRLLEAADAPSDDAYVLLALPACTPGSEMRCGFTEFLEVVAPVARWIAQETGFRVLARPHPGRRDPASLSVLRASPLGPWVELDAAEELLPSLMRSGVVISAHSTVLFDAFTVGKVPVALRSRCFHQPLHLPHEVIDLRTDFAPALRNVLSPGMRLRYRGGTRAVELDWAGEVERLLRDKATNRLGVRHSDGVPTEASRNPQRVPETGRRAG